MSFPGGPQVNKFKQVTSVGLILATPEAWVGEGVPGLMSSGAGVRGPSTVRSNILWIIVTWGPPEQNDRHL